MSLKMKFFISRSNIAILILLVLCYKMVRYIFKKYGVSLQQLDLDRFPLKKV